MNLNHEQNIKRSFDENYSIKPLHKQFELNIVYVEVDDSATKPFVDLIREKFGEYLAQSQENVDGIIQLLDVHDEKVNEMIWDLL